MPTDFKVILNSLKQEVSSLASSSLIEAANEASSDGHMLLGNMKEDLKNWTNELAKGEISKEDFKDLVLGQADLIEMAALKHKGLAKVKVDKFKSDVLNLVINTIVGLV
jgi:hypothetical protein